MLIDQATQQSPSDKPVMSLSAFSIQGKRNHMEDFYDIGYQMKPCDQLRPNEWPYEYFYFGIFDGHGGCEAANFAKQNLLKSITKQKDFWSTNDDDVKRAIRRGYADTHAAMREAMPTWTRTSKTYLPSTAGTTASVLFIKNGKFYIGHVGDSRIVISEENPSTKNWISRSMTKDHKPEDEVERIQRAGGEVRDKIGVHRVVWKRPILNKELESMLMSGPQSAEYDESTKQVYTYPVAETLVEAYQTIPFLAIARSLGDFWSINPYTGQYVVSPEPDISCRPISPNDKCILLATDGLWNVINSSQAVRMLQELNILKSGKRRNHEDKYFLTDNFYDVAGTDNENHAQSLVYFAYQIWERRRLRSDNITCVVAMLHDILGHYQKTHNYATRANVSSDRDISIRQESDMEPIQLGHGNSYMEKIRLNKEPKFCLHDICDEKWRRLERFLVFPPTILEQEYGFKPNKLVYPRNYMRLSIASCRKIPHPEGYTDSYIYIKRVSDDPADDIDMPVRISKKTGKEVKDASAQATQSIHDFGQPWNQLLDEDEEEDDVELVFEHELVDGDVIVEDGVETLFVASPKEDKSIPQLRCLLMMNCSPPRRRSSRNTSYMSVSENAKRKSQASSGTPIPKAKRRKSQPVRCNLARA